MTESMTKKNLKNFLVRRDKDLVMVSARESISISLSDKLCESSSISILDTRYICISKLHNIHENESFLDSILRQKRFDFDGFLLRIIGSVGLPGMI